LAFITLFFLYNNIGARLSYIEARSVVRTIEYESMNQG
jgi:hypothetical protein